MYANHHEHTDRPLTCFQPRFKKNDPTSEVIANAAHLVVAMVRQKIGTVVRHHQEVTAREAIVNAHLVVAHHLMITMIEAMDDGALLVDTTDHHPPADTMTPMIIEDLLHQHEDTATHMHATATHMVVLEAHLAMDPILLEVVVAATLPHMKSVHVTRRNVNEATSTLIL